MSQQPFPKVLHVDTSFAPDHALTSEFWSAKIHYKDIAQVNPTWRKLEQKLRLDFSLALLAKRMAKDFDVLLVGSEKGGIPLAWLGVDKPIVTIVHQIITRPKRILVGTAQAKWARVGTWAKADGDLMIEQYGYPANHLFNYTSSPMDRFDPSENIDDGPMISLGVAKRDYVTLVNALRGLPGVEFLTRHYIVIVGVGAEQAASAMTTMTVLSHGQPGCGERRNSGRRE